MVQNQENRKDIRKIVLDCGKYLTLTGVECVNSFSPESLKLTTAGNKLFVTGSGIKIISFDKSTGSLNAEGDITSIRYGEKKTPFFKRLFG